MTTEISVPELHVEENQRWEVKGSRMVLERHSVAEYDISEVLNALTTVTRSGFILSGVENAWVVLRIGNSFQVFNETELYHDPVFARLNSEAEEEVAYLPLCAQHATDVDNLCLLSSSCFPAANTANTFLNDLANHSFGAESYSLQAVPFKRIIVVSTTELWEAEPESLTQTTGIDVEQVEIKEVDEPDEQEPETVQPTTGFFTSRSPVIPAPDAEQYEEVPTNEAVKAPAPAESTEPKSVSRQDWLRDSPVSLGAPKSDASDVITELESRSLLGDWSLSPSGSNAFDGVVLFRNPLDAHLHSVVADNSLIVNFTQTNPQTVAVEMNDGSVVKLQYNGPRSAALAVLEEMWRLIPAPDAEQYEDEKAPEPENENQQDKSISREAWLRSLPVSDVSDGAPVGASGVITRLERENVLGDWSLNQTGEDVFDAVVLFRNPLDASLHKLDYDSEYVASIDVIDATHAEVRMYPNNGELIQLKHNGPRTAAIAVLVEMWELLN